MNIDHVEENGVFAKFNNLPILQYNIVKCLYTNEDLWKLLYYDTPNALFKDNLTNKLKSSLIYNVQGEVYPTDMSRFKVFMNDVSDDMWPDMSSVLRVYVSSITPTTRTNGTFCFDIDVLTHTKIDMLQNNLSRKVCLLSNVLGTLNGAEIDGLGVLAFSRQSSYEDKVSLGSASRERAYSGYKIVMSTHYSA